MPTDAGQQPGEAPLLTPLLAAAVCGSVLPLQSRANAELAGHVGAIGAATVSFGSGLVILTVMVLLVPALRRRTARIPAAVAAGRLRWWQILGGVSGGILVASQSYAVPLVGVTAFLIAMIGGQSVSALLVDRRGLGPSAPQPIRPGRVLAALLAVAGVAVAASAPGRGQGADVAGLALALPVVVVFCSGMLVSVQQAFNGVLTTVSRDPLATAWFNFLTGSATLSVLGALTVSTVGRTPGPVGADLPWWAWTGGALGIVFIVLSAWAVQHLPVLVFVLVTVTTQLAVGVALDALAPGGTALLGPQLLLGVGIALVASVWAAVAQRRARIAARVRA